MSVASFCTAMAPYARQAAVATGLDCRLFLTQWGYESTWGTSSVASHNNFAGIEHSSGKGCTCCTGDGVYTICPNVQDFTNLYIAILEQGIYASVRATAGQALSVQMVALGNSPWAAGHYAGSCGSPGCALIEVYNANAAAINACLGTATCTPPCAPGSTCVAGTCVPAPPPPAGSLGGLGTVLLVVGTVALGAAAWEHRERLEALLSSGKRARRAGGFV